MPSLHGAEQPSGARQFRIWSSGHHWFLRSHKPDTSAVGTGSGSLLASQAPATVSTGIFSRNNYVFVSTMLMAALVAAQNTVISASPPSSSFSAGDTFVIEADRSDSLTNSQEVSVAIGLLSCSGRAPPGTCDGIDPSQRMGSILFAGPYTPQLLPGSMILSQNFSVTVPEGFHWSGPTALSVAHFSLVGALFFPSLQVVNETVFIQ